MKAKKKVLYIVNFYGSPPLNYFEKYLKESDLADLTVLKLPAVRLTKNRLFIDSFIMDNSGKREEINIDIFFPLPPVLIFLSQYLVNFVLLFILINKSKINQFDICIGETSFGSACAYLLKIIRKAKFCAYMNGDILPNKKDAKKFYFSNANKIADLVVISGQMLLRKLGSKCDVIWYVTDKIRQWDLSNGIFVTNYFFAAAATIDYDEFKRYSKKHKQKNTLGYIGRLDEFAGLDIVIKSIKDIRKKIPDIKFLVIGGGNVSVDHYKAIANKNGVLNNITFYGYIPEMKDAFNILSKASLGMALYKPDRSNVSLATDVSKVKEYLKVGLPVVIAKGGPSVINDIAKFNSGIVVDYNPQKITDSIIDALTNKNKYIELQKGVEEHAKTLDYKKHFRYVWNEIIKYYDRQFSR